MNLEQLPYFIAIARSKSLSDAARSVGVSQPALSKYLSELERSLGLELFFREKKKLQLTQAGRIYLRAACKILDIQSETMASIGQRGQKKKRINIGITPHQGAKMLSRIWSTLQIRFPDTELNYLEGYTDELYEMVRSGKADCAIASVHGSLEGLDFLPLVYEELMLCVPMFYRQRCVAQTRDSTLPVDLQEFSDVPFVLLSPETTVGKISQQIFKEAQISPTVVFSSRNSWMVNGMLKAGMGVGFAPASVVPPSEQFTFLHLKHPHYLQIGIVTRIGHLFSEEERYLFYLQMKIHEHEDVIHLCRGDVQDALMDEFDEPDFFIN